MISPKKQAAALKAIQQLIIFSRKMAYDRVSHEKIAELLDDIEYLPTLILEEEDRTDAFGKYLEGIAKQHNMEIILDIYNG